MAEKHGYKSQMNTNAQLAASIVPFILFWILVHGMMPPTLRVDTFFFYFFSKLIQVHHITWSTLNSPLGSLRVNPPHSVKPL